MFDELVPVVVGFALTTVLGGLLGTYLQRRSWDHQNEARLRDEEFRHADEVCAAISQLLDKRLYRMLRLFYSVRRLSNDSTSTQDVEQRLSDYNSVLYEWNDRLNLNLALVGTYFGESARDWLDNQIYENFQRAGSDLETLYRHAKASSESPVIAETLERELLLLNDQVYRIGVFMMTQLRAGSVGREAPQPLALIDSPANVPGGPTSLAGVLAKDSDESVR
jgi:hypothetical protein